MTMRLKLKYRRAADDRPHYNKPVKGGRGGSARSGGNAGKRVIKQGSVHPIGFSGRTLAIRKKAR